VVNKYGVDIPFAMFEVEVRKAVKERYSRLASSTEACCVGGSCSTTIPLSKEVPLEASNISAGCGSPLTLVTPKEGDTVLDLGCGGGIDVFVASRMVGETGRVIGVDSTPEMIWRARETKEKYGSRFCNVEFRLGEIEHLPVKSETVDWVISNCVINLSPDKLAVLEESLRVLRNGGTLAVADVTLPQKIPEIARGDMNSWSACLTGALIDSDYLELLHRAGFKDARIEHISTTNIGEYQFPYHSSHITAVKLEGVNR
jgi:ubiquinone/menaquinone biosynthesis C-methylase UbiE